MYGRSVRTGHGHCLIRWCRPGILFRRESSGVATKSQAEAGGREGVTYVEIGETDQLTLTEQLTLVSGSKTFNLGREWYGPFQCIWNCSNDTPIG